MIDPVRKAAEACGGVVALANAIGVKHQTFYSWRRIPAERVRAIHEATQIPMHELRPDLYMESDG